jgi:hypothetical protein
MIYRILKLLAALQLLVGWWLPPDVAWAQGTTTLRTCGKSAFANAAATGTTQLAPSPNQAPFTASPTIGGIPPNTPIYVCGYTLVVPTGTNAGLTYGFPASLPGTGCGASPTPIMPSWPAGTYIDGGDNARGLSVPPGNNLCLTVTGTGPAQILVYYDNSSL